MNLITFIGYLFGATFNLFLGILKIFFIIAIAGIAGIKGYRAWLWGLVTLILPWPFPLFLLILITSLPKKVPKLPKHMRHDPAFEGKNPVIASIMALCAMIAKSDGNVTKEEIHFIKEFVKSYFGETQESINSYADAFNYGKDHPEEYLAFVDIIMGYYRTRRDYVMALAFLFVGVAAQEGALSGSKDEQTRKILMALGITAYEYEILKQRIMNPGGYGYEQYQGGGYSGGSYQSQENLVKKYTQVLGVPEDASWTEIKKAYRKLVKEYHPDKLSAGSVPPEYIEFANQKIRDINEAYEYLEKVKGDK